MERTRTILLGTIIASLFAIGIGGAAAYARMTTSSSGTSQCGSMNGSGGMGMMGGMGQSGMMGSGGMPVQCPSVMSNQNMAQCQAMMSSQNMEQCQTMMSQQNATQTCNYGS